MPFPKKRKPLQFTEEELRTLASIRKSRSEEKRRSQRASFLLDSFAGQGDQAIARQHQVGRSTERGAIRACTVQAGALRPEVPGVRSGSGPGRIAETGQAAAVAGRRDCLGAELCVPEAQGFGIFLRTVDLQIIDGSCAPALRLRRTPGAAPVKPLQTPQDTATGRTSPSQNPLLRGKSGSRLRDQNSARTACLQGGSDRQ